MEDRLQFCAIRPSKGIGDDGRHMSASQPAARHALFMLLAMLIISYGVANAECSTVHDNRTDMLSLLDFKRAITNDPKQALRSWHAGIPCCKWEGVNCSLTHTGPSGTYYRVTALNLSNLSLSGPISPSIGNLSFLGILDLSVNGFTGELPPLSGLRILQELVLEHNSLHGTIPDSLTNCSKLSYIMLLGGNFLIGEIPPNIGIMSNLYALDLSENNLTGTIPPSLKNITQLAYIFLDDNKLTGTIPDEMGQLPNLVYLVLGGNMLSGRIPETIGKLGNLNLLDLGGNSCSGPIPSSFGNLTKLAEAHLAKNEFEGPITPSIGNLSMLLKLYLSDNNLYGNIP